MRITMYLLAVTLIATSCNSQIADSDSYKRVDNAQWAQELSQADDTPQIIDVRTSGEFEEGSIPGAINIDFLSDGFLDNILAQTEKQETVYIYCQSGGRSAKAAKLLEKEGFSRIIELKTGYSRYEVE